MSLVQIRTTYPADKHIGIATISLSHIDRQALQSVFCLVHHAALHCEFAGVVLLANIISTVAPYTYLEAKFHVFGSSWAWPFIVDKNLFKQWLTLGHFIRLLPGSLALWSRLYVLRNLRVGANVRTLRPSVWRPVTIILSHRAISCPLRVGYISSYGEWFCNNNSVQLSMELQWHIAILQ